MPSKMQLLQLRVKSLFKRTDYESPTYFNMHTRLILDQQSEITRLNDALEAAEQERQEGWRPISEAKTDGTKYLVSEEGNQYVASWYNGYPHTYGMWMIAEAEESSYIPEVIYVNPTHFQLLPNPPIEDK